ncbi:hypothetical protein [Streptomyces fractus]|uniref:hypothetical protein n=1 Tax=Streptomyces fractus TaxID=641806 RepID=UPI003CF1A225
MLQRDTSRAQERGERRARTIGSALTSIVASVMGLAIGFGEVEHVGRRLTQVRDLNGGLWHIRNGEIRSA